MAKEKESTKYFQGVGRRKRSTATARLHEGKGDILVNETPISEFFPGRLDELDYMAPFHATDTAGQFHGTIIVRGGGPTGQRGAVRLAIARALLEHDADRRYILRKKGLLTRDPREKERKKANLHSARRAHQFSKR